MSLPTLSRRDTRSNTERVFVVRPNWRPFRLKLNKKQIAYHIERKNDIRDMARVNRLPDVFSEHAVLCIPLHSN